MNVLLISTDGDAMDPVSSSYASFVERSTVCTRLMVISVHERTNAVAHKITDNLWMFPARSVIRLMGLVPALSVVRSEIFFQNKLQADVIVAENSIRSFFIAYIIASIYKKPLHLRAGTTLISAKDINVGARNYLRWTILRLLLSRADSIAVSHDQACQTLVSMDPLFKDRIIVIPRHIDVEVVAHQPVTVDLHMKYTSFRAIMLAVGPLRKEQNFEIAINALAEVSKYHENIGLLIVGNGSRKLTLEAHAHKMGVASKVVFEPMRSGPDLLSYLKTAYLLICPASEEPHESIIEDAAALGCAIVSSPVGLAPYLIEHQKTGYLCDPHDQTAFNNAVGTLIRNTQVWNNMRAGIQASVRAYSLKDKSQHLDLYRLAWTRAIQLARH